MNKNNPFEGKAVKFDTAEQLEHLAELARGYGLDVGNISNECKCGYFVLSANIAYDYYTNYYNANGFPEIHYSDFIMNIDAEKFTESITRDTPDPIARPEQADMVNHPKHYNVEGYEVIDIIEAFNLNFAMGSALKYLLRAERKGNKVQDLQKAIWCIQREIDKSN